MRAPEHYYNSLAILVLFLLLGPAMGVSPIVGPETEEVALQQYGRILHVSLQAGLEGAADGTRAAPYQRLEDAVESALPESEDKRAAILVAAGEYILPSSLRMKSGIDLYGGFDTDNWSRDIAKNRTIVKSAGRRATVIGADDARIDGFEIVGARSKGPGGAFLCDRSSPVISNNAIEENQTIDDADRSDIGGAGKRANGGAAICCLGSSPLVRNNRFAGNTTEFGGGGAIYCADHSDPKVEANLFLANRSGRTDPDTRSSNGGAIACTHYSHPTIRGNVFFGNHADGRGDGGAIYGEYFCEPVIEDNVFIANSADDDGAAVYFMAGTRPQLVRNLFVGNGPGGGTIRLSKNGLALLEANTVIGNKAGGIVCRAASLVSRNNLVCENLGSGIAGMTSVISSQNDTICGQQDFGITTEQGGARIVNTIVASNRAGQMQLGTNDIWVRYCLLTGSKENDAHGIDALSTTSSLPRDRVIAIGLPPQFQDDSWSADARLIGQSPKLATTEIELTSQFPDDTQLTGRPIRCGNRWTVIRDADYPRLLLWGSIQNEFERGSTVSCYVPISYHLDDDSPCIDRGDSLGAPQVDFDGQVRPLYRATSGKVDIGADEFVRPSSPAAVQD